MATNNNDLNNDLYIRAYSAKSTVMRGNTKLYKEELKELGGKYNSRLQDDASSSGVSPGWIFPSTQLKRLEAFLNTGKVTPPEWAGRSTVAKRLKAVPATPPPSPALSSNCQHCEGLREDMAVLNIKLDRILSFFERSENMRKNMMSGASNMMKNVFGGAAEMMNECQREGPTFFAAPHLEESRFRMAPPSVTILEDEEYEGASSILLD